MLIKTEPVEEMYEDFKKQSAEGQGCKLSEHLLQELPSLESQGRLPRDVPLRALRVAATTSSSSRFGRWGWSR